MKVSDLEWMKHYTDEDHPKGITRRPYVVEVDGKVYQFVTSGHYMIAVEVEDGKEDQVLTSIIEGMDRAKDWIGRKPENPKPIDFEKLKAFAGEPWLVQCDGCEKEHSCTYADKEYLIRKPGWINGVYMNRELLSRTLFHLRVGVGGIVQIETTSPTTPIYIYGPDWRVLIMPMRETGLKDDPSPHLFPHEEVTTEKAKGE